ncbi:MAG: hypothetical protein FD123_2344 [Bacteroidetes bacterium]|nr:MAG: hypothetical protein FD123_2344 [Bacteroidota bacterium]
MAARLIKKGALDFINSDNVPITTTFARRITERIKAELARMKTLHRDKIRMFALFGICAAFIFSVFVLLKTAPEALPHAIVIFISVIALLIFLRKEDEPPFIGKNTHAGS